MKSITVNLENGFIGHQLWIASNAYIQKVVSIKTQDVASKDEVLIGKIGELHLFGSSYPSSNTFPKNHFITEYKLTNRMWIKADGHFFEITGVHTSQDEANAEMKSDDKTALIDEIQAPNGVHTFINACTSPAQVNKSA